MINLIEAWRQEDENFYVFALRFLNSMKSYILFAIKKRGWIDQLVQAKRNKQWRKLKRM